MKQVQRPVEKSQDPCRLQYSYSKTPEGVRSTMSQEGEVAPVTEEVMQLVGEECGS